MDAIEYLTEQHREIESLFDQFESAARARPKLRLRRKLVDMLAVHRAVEERIFFPAARDAGMEELLLKAFDEHSAVERAIAEAVGVGEVGYELVAKMSILRRRKRQHSDGEEKELFPRARELLTPERLQVLGCRMADAAEQLTGPGARERLSARMAQA